MVVNKQDQWKDDPTGTSRVEIDRPKQDCRQCDDCDTQHEILNPNRGCE